MCFLTRCVSLFPLFFSIFCFVAAIYANKDVYKIHQRYTNAHNARNSNGRQARQAPRVDNHALFQCKLTCDSSKSSRLLGRVEQQVVLVGRAWPERSARPVNRNRAVTPHVIGQLTVSRCLFCRPGEPLLGRVRRPGAARGRGK